MYEGGRRERILDILNNVNNELFRNYLQNIFKIRMKIDTIKKSKFED